MVKVAILGGGLSGLIYGYYIKKNYPDCQLTILEKSAHIGGHIHTVIEKDFVFEMGPFGLRSQGAGRSTLDFVRELGLWDELVLSEPDAKQSFIYYRDRLVKVPRNLWQGIFSPLMGGLIPALWRDLWSEAVLHWDVVEESAATFFQRHFGKTICDNLIDPWLSIERLGDIEKLSIQAAYPQLAEYESCFGSLIKGYLKKEPKITGQFLYPKHVQQSRWFSFKKGLGALTAVLGEQLAANLVTSASISQIRTNEEGVEVMLSDGQSLQFDQVISTLPAYGLAAVLDEDSIELTELLRQIEYAPLATVCLGYNQKVNHRYRGAGYLVPFNQKQGILGACFNNQIFPQQAPADGEVITVYIGGARHPLFHSFNENYFIHLAIEKTKSHLHINQHPEHRQCKIIPRGLPQFNVGHLGRIERIKQLCPRPIHITGNFMHQFTVDDVIRAAGDFALEMPQYQSELVLSKQDI